MSEQICAAHCAGQEFLHLRVLVFRSVHNHKEHVEVVMNVAPDEPRMGVEEHLEKSVLTKGNRTVLLFRPSLLLV